MKSLLLLGVVFLLIGISNAKITDFDYTDRFVYPHRHCPECPVLFGKGEQPVLTPV